jgi:hypothetical protein
VSKKQKVTIVTKPENSIQINRKDPEMIDGKVLLPRNGEPQQITVKRSGYKNEYKVCVPYRLGAATVCNYVGNFILFGLPVIVISPTYALVSGGLAALYNNSYYQKDKRCYDYDKTIEVGTDLIKIPIKDSTLKQIQVSDISFNVKPEKAIENVISFENYQNKSMKNSGREIKKESNVESNSPYLLSYINEILAKSGFVDTTNNLLTKGFQKNVYLEATIIGYKANYILPKFLYLNGQVLCFMNIELETKWDLCDIYKNKLYTDTVKSKSGEFVVFEESANSTYMQDAIKDATEIGLYSFIQNPIIQKNIKLGVHNENIEKPDTILKIDLPSKFVSDIDQAVNSSLTVKTKSGHGSGFVIGENGYIITNYHVISDSSKLEVIFNDGTKHLAKIIRINKDIDLALLKVNASGLVPFRIAENLNSSIGSEIFAIGTPSAVDLNQTLSKGIISSFRKTNETKLIQTDASVNGGNSGGPLIDKEGNLIGVVSSKIVGKGVEGLAFAIPSSDIFKSLNIQYK